ncbi:MAG: hypothetical protein OXE92_07860 [Bacteroidetes bacterium]|nr:hypothetical protein [Bacteroidota bacterium]MCY4205622.1 hypothetical protein [Bacteroidota bacterium]
MILLIYVNVTSVILTPKFPPWTAIGATLARSTPAVRLHIAIRTCPVVAQANIKTDIIGAVRAVKKMLPHASSSQGRIMACSISVSGVERIALAIHPPNTADSKKTE